MASSGAKPDVVYSVGLTKQTGNKKTGGKKRGHSPVPALPLHRICTRADGHMGDATLFKESEVDS